MKKICKVLFALLFVVLFVTGCGNKGLVTADLSEEDVTYNNGEQEYANAMSDEDIDASKINILVPQNVNFTKERIAYLNGVLQKKGCDYQVDFITVETEYFEPEFIDKAHYVMEETNVGDIIFSGMNSTFDSSCAEFVRSGELLDLTDYLKDSELYQVYSELQWEGQKVDGNIYTIPNEYLNLSQWVVAVDKAAVDEKEISKYASSRDVLLHLDELGKLVKDNMKYTVLCDLIGEDLVKPLGYYNMGNLIVNRETNEVTLPLENKEFTDVLCVMNQMYINGKLDNSLWGSELDMETRLETKDFAIYIGVDTEALTDEKYYKFTVPVYREQLYGSSLAILKQSDKVGVCLDFLTRIRMDADVANALILGEENKDYKMVDGFACDMEGTPVECGVYKRIFGTYELVKPCQDDYVVGVDKRTYRENFLNEKCIASPYANFLPVYDLKEEVMVTLTLGTDIFMDLCTIEDKEEDEGKKNLNIFWDTLEAYKAGYHEEGATYRDEIQKQLNSFLEQQKEK